MLAKNTNIVNSILRTKKSANADLWKSQNDPMSSALTFNSIANQKGLSSVDNILGCGPAGNRTPETLLSRQSSDLPKPTADSL